MFKILTSYLLLMVTNMMEKLSKIPEFETKFRANAGVINEIDGTPLG